MKTTELLKQIKPYVLGWITLSGGGSGPYAPTPHDLNSAHHSGSLADSQATQFLKTDGSRQLTGNLSVAAGVTVDGVDISAHVAASDAHHDLVTAGDGIYVSGQQVAVDVTHILGSGLTESSNNIDLNWETATPQDVSLTAGSAGSVAEPSRGDHRHVLNQAITPTWTGAHTFGTTTELRFRDSALKIWSSADGYLDLASDSYIQLDTGGYVNVGDVSGIESGTVITVNSIDSRITLDAKAGDVLANGHFRPSTTNTYDIGSSTRLWRKGYLSELDTVIFTENSVTISGARQVWGHNQGTLAADVSTGATTVDFGQAMTPGDFVEFRGYLQVEFMTVLSLVSDTTYNVTRNLDGTGANAWSAGTPYLVLGASGDARVEIDAAGPYLRILEQGATYDAATEYVRIGNMNGVFGTGANDYWGLGVGDYAGGNYLRYDDTNGFEIKFSNGGIALDDDGAHIEATTTFVSTRAYGFDYSGTYIGGLEGRWYTAGLTYHLIQLHCDNVAGENSEIDINAESPTGYASVVDLTATSGSDYARLAVVAADSGAPTGYILTNDVPIYINDTGNDDMTVGLTINQGAADDEILALKSSDVAHGMTDITETDTFGVISKAEATSGGLSVLGYKDADGSAGLALQLAGQLGENADTTKSTSGRGIVEIGASIKSGSGIGAVNSDGNVFVIRPYGNTRFIFDAEGSAHADVEWTTFDSYDDLALLTDFERAMLAQKDPVKCEFVDFLKYNHAALENAGVVHFDREQSGHAMVNFTRLSMLLVGALQQIGARITQMEERLCLTA